MRVFEIWTPATPSIVKIGTTARSFGGLLILYGLSAEKPASVGKYVAIQLFQ